MSSKPPMRRRLPRPTRPPSSGTGPGVPVVDTATDPSSPVAARVRSVRPACGTVAVRMPARHRRRPTTRPSAQTETGQPAVRRHRMHTPPQHPLPQVHSKVVMHTHDATVCCPPRRAAARRTPASPGAGRRSAHRVAGSLAGTSRSVGGSKDLHWTPLALVVLVPHTRLQSRRKNAEESPALRPTNPAA